MIRVVVESPFTGEVETNVRYARMAVRDSLLRGEAPWASHLLYTQLGILNDGEPEERKHGIEAGLSLARGFELTALYVERGISSGMVLGAQNAQASGRQLVARRVNGPEALEFKEACTIVADFYCDGLFHAESKVRIKTQVAYDAAILLLEECVFG